MAKTKKTKEKKLEPIDEGTLNLNNSEKLEQCEWVFQFDEDAPQIFAWTGEDMADETPTVTFTISNTKGAYISFKSKQNGKTFKLFARELTDEGRQLREYNLKSTTNESTNQEA